MVLAFGGSNSVYYLTAAPGVIATQPMPIALASIATVIGTLPKPAGLHCEATTVVSSGPDTHHACFMVALKVDLYQPKYANIPITYNMTPCPPGTGVLDKYGVGSLFNGFNAMGMPENLTITECHYDGAGGFGKVVFETKGI